MSNYIILAFIFISLSGLARDRREVKKEYTKNLRLWLTALEAAADDHQYPDSKQRLTATKKNLEALFDKISEKLSPKRRQSLQSSLKDYLESLPNPSAEVYLKIRRKSLDYFRVIRSPPLVPDFKLGQSVYNRHCQVCHGAKGEGDGPYTKNKAAPMVPLPKSFPKQRRLGVRAPFSYFNTLLVGIPETSMASFEKTLTFHEMWSVSFFLSTFPDAKSVVNQGPALFTTKQLADLTNLEILMKLKELNENQDQLVYLRNYSSFTKKTP